MDKKINVTPNGNTLELREGEALILREPKIISLNGIISTPGDFAAVRKATFEELKANVIANYTSRRIILSINESDFYGSTITGALELHPDLKSLQINDNKEYNEKELFRKLNFFGRYFKDIDAHKELLGKLQKFKAKITQNFVNADDYKGSAAIEKITEIEHEIPLLFELSIPIFTGGDARSFVVDICVSVRDGGVSFWFESVELHELIQRETERIFEGELKRLSDYVIIKQW